MTAGDDDNDLFLKEMADVAPLKQVPRARIVRGTPEKNAEALAARREAAVAEPVRDTNTLKEEGIEPLDPWYVLEFKRPGIQNGVFRKLKQGRYAAEARLDLHRMTARKARVELFDFISECYALGLRSVMLVHGKGDRKPDKEKSSILKGCVDHWLRQLEVVQAFHSAQPQHGGTGAVYVLLSKSEEKKRENREKFMKGRVPYDSGR
jgi:DNA-nicking Smr family endonuclease